MSITKAKIANIEKVTFQKKLVRIIQDGGRGRANISGTWRRITANAGLVASLHKYEFFSAQRRSWLNRIAFPKCNIEETAAALDGNHTAKDVADIANGIKCLVKDSAGYVKADKGVGAFKIIETTKKTMYCPHCNKLIP